MNDLCATTLKSQRQTFSAHAGGRAAAAAAAAGA
jgi:hypothetical protein